MNDIHRRLLLQRIVHEQQQVSKAARDYPFGLASGYKTAIAQVADGDTFADVRRAFCRELVEAASEIETGVGDRDISRGRRDALLVAMGHLEYVADAAEYEQLRVERRLRAAVDGVMSEPAGIRETLMAGFGEGR